MSNLQRFVLGPYVKLTSGFPFSSKYFSTEDGIPLVRIRDILESKIETYYTGPFDDSFLIRSGDVLIGMDGDFNVVRWKNVDALLNQRILKVQSSDASRVDTNYLFHWLKPFIEKVHTVTAATTVKHLSTKDIAKAVVEFPDSHVQQKVARVLDTVDNAIEETESLIAKYQQIKAGLMHDLFTRGVTADGKLRPPREQAPELYHETPIGWIPKEWQTSGLKSKAVPGIPHLRTGPFGSSLKGEHWVEVGHPVITIGALGEGEFIESELLYVGDFDARRLKEFQLKPGEVVFSRVADVGRSVVVRDEQAGWIMSSNLMRIALDKKLVVPDFLQQQLSFDQRIKRQIRAKVNSGGRDVANSEILNQLLFAWPSYPEQQLIVERAAAVDDRLRSEVNKQRKLEKEKAGLMHDLLTGKVRIIV